MQVFYRAREMTAFLAARQTSGHSVGFVPTMGALHGGHISLVERSLAECDTTVCSIYVNPAQFNDPADLARYPRTIEADLALLEKAGCDAAFVPDDGDIYNSVASRDRQFPFGYPEEVLEGDHRPGHFQGVGKVVDRLLEIVPCKKLYLGSKDYQQYLIIRKLVHDILRLPIAVVPCPIVREADGLAMSSRNVRLDAIDRRESTLIYRALCWTRDNAEMLPLQELKAGAEAIIRQASMLEEIEYFEICDAANLLPVKSIDDAAGVIALVAARFPHVRLIDNMMLKEG